MIFYTLHEIAFIVLAAIVLDWLLGDPRRLPHPVVGIGKLITALERKLRSASVEPVSALRTKGVVLTVVVTLTSLVATWGVCALLGRLHPWLGYAAHAWLISTTIAVKGLKDAAMTVYVALDQGDIVSARERVGWIVGRDTAELDEPEVSRAAVETVAENTVDAVVSPIVFALVGAAPFALFYRATNTLDSMVGYNNDKYRDFGWASAKWDDVMNYVPARLTGWLLVLAALLRRGMSARQARCAVRQFARLHPSPNSGIPESAVAGALGIELGGTNRYGGVASERARLGWPNRRLDRKDIAGAVRLLYGVSYLIAGGLLCVGFATYFVNR